MCENIRWWRHLIENYQKIFFEELEEGGQIEQENSPHEDGLN